VDTACWTAATDAVACLLAVSTTATTPDLLETGWRLLRADVVWASNDQDRSTARTSRTPTLLRMGLATAATVSCRWYAAVQLAPRRTALLGLIRVESRAGGEASSVMASSLAEGAGLVAGVEGHEGQTP
jgi:hypothetical protein